MKRLFAILMIIAMGAALCGCGGPKVSEITIMSQNVRLDGVGDEVDVLYRAESFYELIKKYQPDLIGVQEYTPLWHYMMEDYLAESGYKIEMKYRCDWAEEATAVIYNAKRLELLHAEHFWLSDTPEEESLSYGDTLPRICTRCDFKDKETGAKFTHINTHFGLTATAQESSGTQINTYVKENLKGQPVFLTGDMNTQTGSLAYINITAEDLLYDSALIADEFGETCGTFNGFEDGVFSGPIDYVFITPDLIHADYYSVLLDKPNDIFISDHYAVLAKCTVKNK